MFVDPFQVFTLIGFLCIQFSSHSGITSAQFFSTIAMISFWFTGILLVLYLFHVIYVFSKVPWVKIEFFFCLGATLFLGLTSALVISKGVGLFTAAGVSIINTYNLIVPNWLNFRCSQTNRINFYSLFCSPLWWISRLWSILFFFFQFFGFVAMCAYGYDAFLKYKMYNTVVTNVITRTTTVTVA